ncbi:DUF2249 domain-containing protein [Paenibacillus oryzisoli]|uniref:DUF2249 domain-containing protein n=1 Tax=Paenibacillus oryzisoli TaxID=1850517 RepID=UPI003D2CAF33
MNKHERVVELDVRPHLKKKLEPFKLIMDAVTALEPEDLFILHAPFKPTPLFGVMKVKGYSHREEQIEAGYWIVAFAREVHVQWGHLELSQFKKRDEEEEVAHDEP